MVRTSSLLRASASAAVGLAVAGAAHAQGFNVDINSSFVPLPPVSRRLYSRTTSLWAKVEVNWMTRFSSSLG